MNVAYEHIEAVLDRPIEGENAAMRGKVLAAAYRASARLLRSTGFRSAARELEAHADAVIAGVPEALHTFDGDAETCS